MHLENCHRNFRMLIILISIVIGSATVNSADLSLITRYELKSDGFGPVKLGMTPEQASKALGVSLTPASELDEDDFLCHYEFLNAHNEDVGFMVEENQITRIDIYTDKASGPGGIRVGQNEDEVRKIFGNKVSETVHPYIGKEGKYLTVMDGPEHGFVFETDKGTITKFRAGYKKPIQYIEGCS